MTIADISKLLQRISKMYNMFDQFMKVFNLIKKKELGDKGKEKDANLFERLMVSI